MAFATPTADRAGYRVMRFARWLGALLLIGGLTFLLIVPLHARADAFLGTVATGLGPSAVAVDAPTGHAFVANYTDNTVTMLDATRGTTLRTSAVGRGPLSLAVASRTHRVLVLNSLDQSVSALDAATDRLVYTTALPPLALTTALAVDERSGHTFVAGIRPQSGACGPGGFGAVVMLDIRRGTILHSACAGRHPENVAVDGSTRRVFVADASNDSVVVLDAASGAVIRTVAVGATPLGIAADERTGRVFVANQDADSVTILDAATGSVLRTVTVGHGPRSVATAAHLGRVYIVNADDNTLSLLNARTGAPLRTVPLEGSRPDDGPAVAPLDVVVDERRGRAFVINGGGVDRALHPTSGSVSMLDARTGQILGRLPAGHTPAGLAIDAATGHLVAANADGGGPMRTGLAVLLRRWVPTPLWRWLPYGAPTTRAGTTGTVTLFDTSHL